ncbi:hypothetical protein AG1IA_02154 [Rhizoctonia solani AG-1 IA]|uniref:Uncharacterized protein n=1 Tax=Thanatephorus cucumeris (strain AG1-IA) TaxID=983506 RepID=L8X412_THACA|nr:hypothetical protein AG1IA_02154 [Rhizoctonia solani AG-1 IA]
MDLAWRGLIGRKRIGQHKQTNKTSTIIPEKRRTNYTRESKKSVPKNLHMTRTCNKP